MVGSDDIGRWDVLMSSYKTATAHTSSHYLKMHRLGSTSRSRARRTRAPRHAPRGPRAAHPRVQREQGLSIAPEDGAQTEKQRANGPATRKQHT